MDFVEILLDDSLGYGVEKEEKLSKKQKKLLDWQRYKLLKDSKVRAGMADQETQDKIRDLSKKIKGGKK